jgi:hypothetical protein
LGKNAKAWKAMLAGSPGPELLAFGQLVAGKPAAAAKVAIPGIPLHRSQGWRR